MGIIPTRKNLELCDKVNASAFCRSVINLDPAYNHLYHTLEPLYYGCLNTLGPAKSDPISDGRTLISRLSM